MRKDYYKQWMTALALLTSVTVMADNLTGRGQNMSFEDLTAQDGQSTGSVANVPTGWNAYINGTQVATDVYDLTGRRVQGTLPRGLYIRGGKKIIVK